MTLRIGVLGAARIVPPALIKPARVVEGVEIAAIAARDRGRATAFATEHGIPRVLDSYADIIEDSTLDAVYVPLPNGLHAKWTIKAIEAGKHVLCEKPFTSNASQARDVAAAANGTVVMEAFHYRYHPLARRMEEIVASGELGEIRRIETAMCFPLPRFNDIRYQFDLAGGALMDAGCYAVHCLRILNAAAISGAAQGAAISGADRGAAGSDADKGAAGGRTDRGVAESVAEPVVTGARALTLRRDARIDRAMVVDFSLPNGATARATASMWSSRLLKIQAKVVGDKGTMLVRNFAVPQLPSRFTVTVGRHTRRERFDSEPTYVHQLRAFAAACAGDRAANLTPPADSIATMELIDAAYSEAGLPLRV